MVFGKVELASAVTESKKPLMAIYGDTRKLLDVAPFFRGVVILSTNGKRKFLNTS